MAVVNTKTTEVTNADTNKDKFASNGYQEIVKVATIEVAAADSDTSTFRLMRLPSNAVITQLELASDALGTSATYDLGIYDIAENNSGGAVDADEFASDLNLSSAVAWTNVLEEAAATDISKIGQPLWQRLGETSDPGKPYDLVATGDTAGDAAGTISVRVRYYLDA